MSPPQMKGRKNRCVTLKPAWLAFDTARYKGKGKSHCIPDPQKKKKKAFEMDCWVGSSLAQVVALMAQPLGAGILGLDKTLAGPRISGHWPILGELLSHAV